MEKLKIRDKILDHPIVQGGMGVGLSLGGLAGAVAATGGVGTISTVGIGFKEEDYYENKVEANKRALQKEVDKAKDISGGKGLISINIMEAITEYEELTSFASTTGADMLVVGAGLPLTLPKLVENKDIAIGPIVSSLRAMRLILRSWTKKHNRLPDFMVVEGSRAGGHLGYKLEEIKENRLLKTIRDIKAHLDEQNLNFPLIGAGGIVDSKGVKEVLDAGAKGVQVGTRFLATDECDGAEELKDFHIEATEEDLEIIKSPVGMPARALKTKFLDKIKENRVPSKRCTNCLKPCNPATTLYCIQDALINAATGNIDNGLVFSGVGVDKVDRKLSVRELIDELLEGIK